MLNLTIFLDKEVYKQDNKLKFLKELSHNFAHLHSTDTWTVIVDNCPIRLSRQIFVTKPGKQNGHFELSAPRL